ncbi:hypothetical protein Tco_0563912 [Tanacetum coccineum]
MITTSKLKISDEFLKILQDNAFNGMDGGDIIDHIGKEAKDIYEVINREYSPIPIPAHCDINKSDKLCRTDEFTVVQHSIGNDGEFVTVGQSNINTVKRTLGIVGNTKSVGHFQVVIVCKERDVREVDRYVNANLDYLCQFLIESSSVIVLKKDLNAKLEFFKIWKILKILKDLLKKIKDIEVKDKSKEDIICFLIIFVLILCKPG